MSNDLKNLWGVDSPAPAGSDQQSQQFKAAYQAELGKMNEHLQYTAVHAEEAKHAPMSAKRDGLTSAFQSALGQIDPANPAKAQSAIDSVLTKARATGAEVASFRQAAEQAYDDWQGRQAEFEASIGQIEELEAWEDAKAPVLRQVSAAIQKQADQRQYAPAGQAFDSLKPKLAPIYKEYQKQKAAKEEFDPKQAELAPRLAEAQAPKFKKLKPQQDEMATGQAAMEAAAGKKDYVQALAVVGTLAGQADAYQTALAEIEQQKAAYEAALAPVKPRVASIAVSEPQYVKLQAQAEAITASESAAEAAGEAEDFVPALSQVQEVATQLDALDAAKAEVDRLKAEYDAALAAVQPRLQAAASSEPQYARLQTQQQEIASAQTAMEAAAQAGEYEQANVQVQALAALLDALEQAKAEIDRQKQAYEAALAELQPRLQAVSAATQPEYATLQAQQQEISSAQTTMEAAAQGGDYEQALAQAEALGAKVEAFEQAKAEIDSQKAEYESGLAELQPRIAAVSASDTHFAKLEPQLQALAQAQGEMESAAQAGDYPKALAALQGLHAQVDEIEAARKDIAGKKDEYEAAWKAVSGRFEALKPSPSAKLETARADIVKAKADMDAKVAAEDFEGALADVPGIDTALGHYEEKLTAVAAAKTEFDALTPALRERLVKAASATDPKLKSQQAELATGQKNMDGAALVGDYDEALATAKELGTQLDAFEKDSAVPSLAELGGELTIYEKSFPAKRGLYIEGAAKIGGSVKFGPAPDAQPGSATKAEVEQSVRDQVEQAILKGKWDYTAGLKGNPGGKDVGLSINATFSCEWGPAKLEFAPAEFSVLSYSREIDAKTGKPKSISGPKLAMVNASFSYNVSRKLDVKGCPIDFAPALNFTIEFTPDYVAIGVKMLEKLAIDTAEGAIAVDGAALASAAAAVALPLAAAAAIGAGMYQEAQNMEASSQAISTALGARKKAAQAAASFAKTLTGGGSGDANAEAQIAQIMDKSKATREEVIAAVVKAQGSYAAIRERELQRLKDQMFATACAAFDKGHQPFSFPESRGPDWGYRASFRKMLKLILYADD